jgi:acyl carrier protein
MNVNSFVTQAKSTDENVATKIRNLIAEHLHLDARHVSDEARSLKDLGVDWLDRLELVMEIEDQFGVEIGDDDIARIEVVGDLIHLVEAQPLH